MNLESLGYTMTALTDSSEALRLFQTEPEAFDLVISDITMSHTTGDHLARQLKAIRDDIPIILCTGYSSSVSEESATGMGVGSFFL